MATRDVGMVHRTGHALRAGRVPTRPGLMLMLALLVGVSVYAITRGAASIPLDTVILLLVDRLPFVNIDTGATPAWERIVYEIRLPRVIAAGVVGAALSISGSAYQGVFRNPLADPYLLGVAAGAGLAVSLAYASPLPLHSGAFAWLPLLAFLGGMGSVVIVYLTARTTAAVDSGSLILAGVALAAVWGGITSFVIINTESSTSQPILSFLFGGFNTSSWSRIGLSLPYIAAGAAIILLHARALNVLQLDEEQASHLGMDVTRTKLVILAAASLVAATAVAIAGIIGFLGLIVPHAIRLMFGGDFRRTLPLTLIGGATLLIAVDLVARTVLQPQEVPVGVLTAILGGPFFIVLLRRRRIRL